MTASHRALSKGYLPWWTLLDSIILVVLGISLFMLALDVGRIRQENEQLRAAVAVLRSNDQMLDRAVVAIARELGMMPAGGEK